MFRRDGCRLAAARLVFVATRLQQVGAKECHGTLNKRGFHTVKNVKLLTTTMLAALPILVAQPAFAQDATATERPSDQASRDESRGERRSLLPVRSYAGPTRNRRLPSPFSRRKRFRKEASILLPKRSKGSLPAMPARLRKDGTRAITLPRARTRFRFAA